MKKNVVLITAFTVAISIVGCGQKAYVDYSDVAPTTQYENGSGQVSPYNTPNANKSSMVSEENVEDSSEQGLPGFGEQIELVDEGTATTGTTESASTTTGTDMSISNEESLDLIELPIVTFYQGDKKLNFMLDSGSNLSIIDINAVNNLKLKYVKLNKVNSILGINGETRDAGFVNMKFSYKHINFDYDFQYLDLSNVVNSLKQDGITIHGILGNQFFVKYKYVLDFNDLIAYSKK